jgi:hypothetical protein
MADLFGKRQSQPFSQVGGQAPELERAYRKIPEEETVIAHFGKTAKGGTEILPLELNVTSEGHTAGSLVPLLDIPARNFAA